METGCERFAVNARSFGQPVGAKAGKRPWSSATTTSPRLRELLKIPAKNS